MASNDGGGGHGSGAMKPTSESGRSSGVSVWRSTITGLQRSLREEHDLSGTGIMSWQTSWGG